MTASLGSRCESSLQAGLGLHVCTCTARGTPSFLQSFNLIHDPALSPQELEGHQLRKGDCRKQSRMFLKALASFRESMCIILGCLESGPEPGKVATAEVTPPLVLKSTWLQLIVLGGDSVLLGGSVWGRMGEA